MVSYLPDCDNFVMKSIATIWNGNMCSGIIGISMAGLSGFEVKKNVRYKSSFTNVELSLTPGAEFVCIANQFFSAVSSVHKLFP